MRFAVPETTAQNLLITRGKGHEEIVHRPYRLLPLKLFVGKWLWIAQIQNQFTAFIAITGA